MKRDELTNIPASVRHRLLNFSRANGEEFGLVLSRFAVERLLYRLSISPHREVFLLKGAALFALWPDLPRRRTRDVDFLGTGEATPERLIEIFRALCQIETIDDGLHFRVESVRVAPIREEQRYGGQRVRLEATLSGARIALQIDVGFGDAVTPAPCEAKYPTLLAFPAPHLKHYPLETVIAEKWQAIVDLGMGNTRLKDFYDLWLLATHREFEGALLADALRATFARRQTIWPETLPEALTEVFTRDAAKDSPVACLHAQKPTLQHARFSRNCHTPESISLADYRSRAHQPEFCSFLETQARLARSRTEATFTRRQSHETGN